MLLYDRFSDRMIDFLSILLKTEENLIKMVHVRDNDGCREGNRRLPRRKPSVAIIETTGFQEGNHWFPPLGKQETAFIRSSELRSKIGCISIDLNYL